MRRKSGSLLGSFLFLIFFIAAAAVGWYWYQTHPEFGNGLIGKSGQARGYLTYEDYLKKREREKNFQEFKKNAADFFNRLLGR